MKNTGKNYGVLDWFSDWTTSWYSTWYLGAPHPLAYMPPKDNRTGKRETIFQRFKVNGETPWCYRLISQTFQVHLPLLISPHYHLSQLPSTVVADAERLLQVYRTAGEIEKSDMGRTASRKWAKKHQRRSNYEKENEKRDGRKARLQETEKAKQMGCRPRYSWQESQNGESKHLLGLV